MLLVAGSSFRTRPMGLVACECGLCRRVTRQQMLVREGADHIMFVSVDKYCSHMRTCLACGNTTAADLRRQSNVISDPAAESWPLPALTEATYPEGVVIDEHYTLLLERVSAGDAEAKQSLLQSAFSAVEWSLEVCSPRVTPTHAMFLVIAPLIVACVGIWRTAMEWDNPKERIVGIVVTVVGAALAALVLEMRVARPRRLSRRAIVPLLVRSLASLRPTEEELSRALAPFVARGSALPYTSSSSSLAAQAAGGV